MFSRPKKPFLLIYMDIEDNILYVWCETEEEITAIMKDNYVQARNCNQTDIYYIINKWWEKLINGEVNFTDIDNGEGTVFVALNDWR